MIHEGFEQWEGGLPVNWFSYIVGQWNGQYNIERVESLTEGESALILRSNVPGLEGLIGSLIFHELEYETDYLELEFDYQCRGSAHCTVSGSYGSIMKWQVTAADSLVHHAVVGLIHAFDSLEPRPFKHVIFQAEPFYGATYSFGYVEFTIDNLVMRYVRLLSQTDPGLFVRHLTQVYPNPAHETVHIRTEKEIDKIDFKDLNGRLIKSVLFQEIIDISDLNSGVYIVELSGPACTNVIKLVIP